MIDQLHQMSDTFWEQAKISGLRCLANHLADNEDGPDYGLFCTDDFDFVKNRQSLIFCEEEHKGFRIRITYLLRAEKAGKIKKGYYSLDLDEDYQPIDDWLVLD